MAIGEGLRYSYSQKLRPSDRLEFALHLIAYLQDSLTCFEQTHPGVGGNHWGASPVQQLNVELRSKLRDAGRYTGLRNSRACRYSRVSRREVAPRRRPQPRQCTQFQLLSSCHYPLSQTCRSPAGGMASCLWLLGSRGPRKLCGARAMGESIDSIHKSIAVMA